MREILFRGKDVDNAEWIYGWYEMYPFERFPVRPCIIPIENAENGYYEHVEVDPTTIGQYTGLTDKNGGKIFEGDIVRVCLNPEICVGAVEFDERVGAFIVKLPENKCSPFLDLYVASNKAPGLIWTEVIGNVHDNQDLLK